MQIEIVTPMADRLGRAYRPGRRYEITDSEARRLIAAGFARPASDARTAADLLSRLGGGLAVVKTTDLALVEAAKAKNIPIKRLRGVPEEATRGGGRS